MDLKGNKITVGELLDDPRAKAVLQRRFPLAMRHPLLGAARTVTLEQLIGLAGPYMSKRTIDDALEELRDL